jgi:hypothetical protein
VQLDVSELKAKYARMSDEELAALQRGTWLRAHESAMTRK